MRIVIVDHGTTAGRFLQFILSEAGHQVTLAQSVTAVFDEVVAGGADATLINAAFRELSGVEICKEVRAESYSGPVLVWGEQRKSLILQAYDHGADDYIVEPFDPREVIARLEAVVRRCQNLHDEILGIVRVGDAELAIGKLTFQTAGHPPVSLTPIEMRLLECLMRNDGITVSSDTLLRWAWGYDAESDSNRVHVYMMRLRRKIEQERTHQKYIHTVRGVGYVFQPAVRHADQDGNIVTRTHGAQSHL